MPKRSIPYYFLGTENPYIPDWQVSTAGGPFQGLTAKGVFNAPPDIEESAIDSIVAAAGAIRGSLKEPCPETNYTSLRRLQFVRASGNTMTIAIQNSTLLISAANTISSILSAGTGDNPEVVCIKLLGEDWANLNDEFNLVYTSGELAVSHRPGEFASKQWVHSGTVEYKADYTNPPGSTVFQAVKAISNNENSPATQLGTVWDTCVGAFEDVVLCSRGKGRSNPLKHRRYILTFLVELDPKNPGIGLRSEQIEVPVTNNIGVRDCGLDITALKGLYCMGYRGESYTRFHKVL